MYDFRLTVLLMRQEYLKCSNPDNSSRSYPLPDNHPYLASDNNPHPYLASDSNPHPFLASDSNPHPYLASDNGNKINLTAVNVQENTEFSVRKNIFKNNLIQNTKKNLKHESTVSKYVIKGIINHLLQTCFLIFISLKTGVFRYEFRYIKQSTRLQRYRY